MDELSTAKGKVIRDPVHGDIFIENKFINIIDTKEFQRLRRIRQLSTADKLFPSALHTRFSHSIGTYYVMKQLIEHFQKILSDMNLEIKEREKDLALAAALLHDIGHGPFSHGFEGIIPDKKAKKHEIWTIEIITSSYTEINKVLKSTFYKDFPEQVAKLIDNSFNSDKIVNSFSKIDLFNIISSLVSSQLDADRMDYLLRDSFHTGVSYGEFDLSRLINSLEISIDEFKNNKYFVCALEKYKSTIEEYLLSRYQMHKEIYLHEFKIEMEKVLDKIIKRAYELYKDKKINKEILPKFFVASFDGNKVNLKDYLDLDDVSIVSLIKRWKNHDDKILSLLSTSFLNRRKYKRVNILDNSPKVIKEFKNKFTKILNQYGYETTDLDNEYFLISKEITDKKIYKSNKEVIWVLRNDGQIKNLIEVSDLIKNGKRDQENDEIEKRIFFINLEMIDFLINDKNAMEEIERLIKMYNIRNHIEIEKKYEVEKKNVFSIIKEKINNWEDGGYTLNNKGQIEQVDYYYDTSDNLLSNYKITMRIRHKNDKKILTIKTPTEESNDRFEYEKEVESEDLNKYKDFILRYIDVISEEDIDNLVKKIKISNNREVVMIKNNNVKFEMAFDDVNYYNNGNNNEHHEYQIEIELKSDYPHRVNLNLLGNYLEENINELKPISDSKYVRALSFTAN